MRCFSAASVLAGAALLIFAATAAEAGVRDRTRSAHGPNGRGFVAQRHMDRGPGHAVVSRSLQGTGGRGVEAARSTTWGDERVTRQRQVHTNNGHNATAWSTIHRTDEGVAVDRSVTTGSGETWSRSRTWPR